MSINVEYMGYGMVHVHQCLTSRKGQIWLIFHFETIFSKTVW